jgi:hypothetical protein
MNNTIAAAKAALPRPGFWRRGAVALAAVGCVIAGATAATAALPQGIDPQGNFSCFAPTHWAKCGPITVPGNATLHVLVTDRGGSDNVKVKAVLNGQDIGKELKLGTGQAGDLWTNSGPSPVTVEVHFLEDGWWGSQTARGNFSLGLK